TDLEGLEFTGADFPYLSANLGFDTDPFLAPLEVEGGQPLDEALNNTVTSSTVADVNGEAIAIIGATVPTIGSISSPGDDLGIFPEDFDSTPTDAQLDALAAIIQAEVDAVLAANEGLDKVILLSHMQQITIEQALAERLEGVDIIVAGGSNTRLFDDEDRARAGDSVQGEYPGFFTGADGAPVAVVNTDGNYKYLGRLVVEFDENGEIIPESYDEDVSGAFATDAGGLIELADGFGGRVIQFGRLEERQEVGDDPGALPPNTVANARYRVTEFDPETNVVTIEGRYKRLTSPLETVGATDSEGNPPSAIHLHAGGRGENGPIVRNFDVSPSNARSGTFSGTFELTEAEALALATGEYYINLHTEDFPAGELRGQIEFDVLDGASTIGETVDPEIRAIVDAVEAQIVATESNVFGVSDVFLNGNRSGTFTPDDPDGVRTQETNLGNLTADANLVYTNEIIAAQSLGDPVVVSIKNGGGIRANIGEIVVPAGGTEAVRVPNSPVLDENGVEVKPEGGISQNDIATVLAFNNGLSVLDITRAELVSFLEGSVAALPGVSGGFPQISGLKFSFDQTQTAQTYDENDAVETPGERVQNAGIFDENDVLVAELVRDGELVGDPNETFRIVTLDFLANGGDEILSSIPDDRQLDLVDIDGNGIDDGDLTGAATFSQDGSEQDALAEYLNDNFNPDNGGTAFAEADAGPATDERIQNLIFREDTVLPPVATNTFEGVLLNEVLGSTTSDDAEYVEITGLAGTSLEGLSLIVVEADNGDTNGQVDRLLDFGAEDVIGDNGFFLLASPTGSATYGVVGDADIPDNFIENSAYTIALVETGTLALGATVDGTETFVDAVSVTDNPMGDNTFVIPAPVVGPDGNFLPAGFVRQTVGVDSDEFEILDFGNDPAVNTPTPASFSDLEITAALNIGPDVLLGAEIVDHDPINQEIYVTSDDGVQVISVDPATLGNVLGLINPTVDGASDSAITTVATKNGIIAMGVPGADEQADGQVFFYESGTLNFLGAVTVGPLPDSLAFNDAGTHVVVANEGESAGGENEPAADPNPEGSVSVIALNLADVSASTVTTIGFDAFTDEIDARGKVQVFGHGLSHGAAPRHLTQRANIFVKLACVDVARHP
ncbi:MAG: CHRD domain-containing protein, partial [Pseudomonadota bacterium]